MDSIWTAIITFSVLGLIFGVILGYVSRHFSVTMQSNPIIEKINEFLPQSQCGQCGYPGCRSYAEAISIRDEKINLCGPGGLETIKKIASLLNIEIQSDDCIDVNNAQKDVYTLSMIDEANCIGCSKCIQICPVDAIVGTMHSMHTVIADLCTGCSLCIPLCPTQCITTYSSKVGE